MFGNLKGSLLCRASRRFPNRKLITFESSILLLHVLGKHFNHDAMSEHEPGGNTSLYLPANSVLFNFIAAEKEKKDVKNEIKKLKGKENH